MIDEKKLADNFKSAISGTQGLLEVVNESIKEFDFSTLSKEEQKQAKDKFEAYKKLMIAEQEKLKQVIDNVNNL